MGIWICLRAIACEWTKSVDLTSKEWRDLVFEGKNKEFGAYQIRKASDKRHNLAVLFTLIGLVIVALLVWGFSAFTAYRARIAAEEALAAEKMSMVNLDEDAVEEEEKEEQKYEEEKKPEVVQEEVAATTQQTAIAIVPPEQVKNEVKTNEEQIENTTAVGIINQAGSDDIDRHKIITEQVQPITTAPVEEKPKPKETEEIFRAVEQQAKFKGNVNKWLASHINYPPSAADNDIQGRVTVQFVVEKDGSIGQVKLLKGVDPSLDKEAMRVVKSMPKWQPAKNNGVVVRSWFTLPIVFRLADR